MRVSLHCFAVTVLCCGGLPAQIEALKASKEYKAGYKLGVAEAKTELEEGHPTLYISGLTDGILELLDKETGLPYTAIAGCKVSLEILGRGDGHDDTIRDHIKLHGLPKNSLKKWEKELFELQKYYNLRTKTEKPIPLAIGGPKRVSPDGAFTITPVQMTFKIDDGTIIPVLGIEVSWQGKKLQALSFFMAKEADLLWGPPGSRFVVIRSKATPTMEHYSAIDLERAS